MKAIINVHNSSAYAVYNGLTFTVKDIFASFITVTINGLTVDFAHHEVLICNFQKELQNAWIKAEGNEEQTRILHHLRSYKMANRIGNTDNY